MLILKNIILVSVFCFYILAFNIIFMLYIQLYMQLFFSVSSTWRRARCEPNWSARGGSRGEQCRVHGDPHQGTFCTSPSAASLKTRPSFNSHLFYFSFISVCLMFVFCLVFFFQALAKLKKIPETIKAIMERLEPELKQIVKRSTTQIADHAYQRGENLAQESQSR